MGVTAVAEVRAQIATGNATDAQVIADLDLTRFELSLASMVSPNQDPARGGSGETRLTWTYHVNPLATSGLGPHGYVKSHTVGNPQATPAAGGTYKLYMRAWKTGLAWESLALRYESA